MPDDDRAELQRLYVGSKVDITPLETGTLMPSLCCVGYATEVIADPGLLGATEPDRLVVLQCQRPGCRPEYPGGPASPWDGVYWHQRDDLRQDKQRRWYIHE